MSTQGFLSGDRRVIPCRDKIKVIAPSVFARSGFIHRLLTCRRRTDGCVSDPLFLVE